jgi:hypothetical protein
MKTESSDIGKFLFFGNLSGNGYFENDWQEFYYQTQ